MDKINNITSSIVAERNRVRPNMHTNQPALPRSNRQYVPPLMLAKGRGKRLSELHSSKTKVGAKSNIDINSYIGARPVIGVDIGVLQSNQGHGGQSTKLSTKGHSTFPRNDNRASFNPSYVLAPSAATLDDYGSYEESFHESNNGENDSHSSPENEDMDVDEGIENFNSLNNEDVDENILENAYENACDNDYEHVDENADENPLEEPGANQQVLNSNGDSFAKKATNNGKKRGRNKCKEIAKLKPGEKLEITFYNNRAVGPNHEVFARHLGIIVRDTNIVPVRVHKWKDIGDREKDHMWTAVTDVFHNDNMELYREHVLHHMKELWTNWRSDLLRYNVTKKNISLKAAYNRKPPNGLDEKKWKWLIKEIYSDENFKKASARNSANRLHYRKELAHRTGSKPFRQVIWKDLGGNKGIKPNLVDVFHSTRKKGTSLPNIETTQKLDEIRETMESDPSLSHVQVAQKVFKSKSRDRVVGFGGGVKLTDIRGARPSREELEAELNTTKKQNQILESSVETLQDENNQLKGRMCTVESKMKMFQDLLMNQLNVSLTPEN